MTGFRIFLLFISIFCIHYVNSEDNVLSESDSYICRDIDCKLTIFSVELIRDFSSKGGLYVSGTILEVIGLEELDQNNYLVRSGEDFFKIHSSLARQKERIQHSLTRTVLPRTVSEYLLNYPKLTSTQQKYVDIPQSPVAVSPIPDGASDFDTVRDDTTANTIPEIKVGEKSEKKLPSDNSKDIPMAKSVKSTDDIPIPFNVSSTPNVVEEELPSSPVLVTFGKDEVSKSSPPSKAVPTPYAHSSSATENVQLSYKSNTSSHDTTSDKLRIIVSKSPTHDNSDQPSSAPKPFQSINGINQVEKLLDINEVVNSQHKHDIIVSLDVSREPIKPLPEVDGEFAYMNPDKQLNSKPQLDLNQHSTESSNYAELEGPENNSKDSETISATTQEIPGASSTFIKKPLKFSSSAADSGEDPQSPTQSTQSTSSEFENIKTIQPQSIEIQPNHSASIPIKHYEKEIEEVDDKKIVQSNNNPAADGIPALHPKIIYNSRKSFTKHGTILHSRIATDVSNDLEDKFNDEPPIEMDSTESDVDLIKKKYISKSNPPSEVNIGTNSREYVEKDVQRPYSQSQFLSENDSTSFKLYGSSQSTISDEFHANEPRSPSYRNSEQQSDATDSAESVVSSNEHKERENVGDIAPEMSAITNLSHTKSSSYIDNEENSKFPAQSVEKASLELETVKAIKSQMGRFNSLTSNHSNEHIMKFDTEKSSSSNNDVLAADYNVQDSKIISDFHESTQPDYIGLDADFNKASSSSVDITESDSAVINEGVLKLDRYSDEAFASSFSVISDEVSTRENPHSDLEVKPDIMIEAEEEDSLIERDYYQVSPPLENDTASVKLGFIQCLLHAANESTHFTFTKPKDKQSLFARISVSVWHRFINLANAILNYLPSNYTSNIDKLMNKWCSLPLNFLIAWVFLLISFVICHKMFVFVGFYLTGKGKDPRLRSESAWLELEERARQLSGRLVDLENLNSRLSVWSSELSSRFENQNRQYSSVENRYQTQLREAKSALDQSLREMKALRLAHDALVKQLAKVKEDGAKSTSKLDDQIRLLTAKLDSSEIEMRSVVSKKETANAALIITLEEEKKELLSRSDVYQARLVEMDAAMTEQNLLNKTLEDQLVSRDRELASLRDAIIELKCFELHIESNLKIANECSNSPSVPTNSANYSLRKSSSDNLDDGWGAEVEDIDDIDVSESSNRNRKVASPLSKIGVMEKAIADFLDVGKVKAALSVAKEQIKTEISRREHETNLREQLQEKLASLEDLNADLSRRFNEAEEERLSALKKLEILSEYFKERETVLQRSLGRHAINESESTDELNYLRQQFKTADAEIKSLTEQVTSSRRDLIESERASRRRITELDKRLHENWLAARASENLVRELRNENATLRQKLGSDEKSVLQQLMSQRFQIPPPLRRSGNNFSPSSPAAAMEIRSNSRQSGFSENAKNALYSPNLLPPEMIHSPSNFPFIPPPPPPPPGLLLSKSGSLIMPSLQPIPFPVSSRSSPLVQKADDKTSVMPLKKSHQLKN